MLDKFILSHCIYFNATSFCCLSLLHYTVGIKSYICKAARYKQQKLGFREDARTHIKSIGAKCVFKLVFHLSNHYNRSTESSFWFSGNNREATEQQIKSCSGLRNISQQCYSLISHKHIAVSLIFSSAVCVFLYLLKPSRLFTSAQWNITWD